MKKINMGVIGCGDAAILHYLPFIKNSEKINLIALCDKNEGRLKKVAKFFGVKNIFISYKELLSSGLVEAVANLTPPIFHYPINLDCLNAKVHVYSEKLISYEIKEIENLIKASQVNKVKLACAPSTPLNPAIIKAKQLLNEGVIGKPCYAIANFSNGGPASQWFNIVCYKNIVKQEKLYGFEEISTDPTWFFEKGGGALADLGIYVLTSLVFLLGSVKYMQSLSGTQVPEVEVMGGTVALGKKIKVKIEDCTLLLLEFNGGPYASVTSSFCVKATKMPVIEIYGSKGTISITANPDKLEVFLENNSGLSAWNNPYEDLSGWRLGIGVEHLAECILENKEPVISATLAKHVTELALKAPQVSLSGERTLLETKI